MNKNLTFCVIFSLCFSVQNSFSAVTHTYDQYAQAYHAHNALTPEQQEKLNIKLFMLVDNYRSPDFHQKKFEEIENTLQQGADPNYNSLYPYNTPTLTSAFMTAISYRNPHLTILLIKYGAHVNKLYIESLTQNSRTPLMLALAQSDPSLKIIQILIDTGADINKTDLLGNNALLFALHGYTPSSQVIKTLIDAGTNLFIPNKSGESAFERLKKLKNFTPKELQNCIVTHANLITKDMLHDSSI